MTPPPFPAHPPAGFSYFLGMLMLVILLGLLLTFISIGDREAEKDKEETARRLRAFRQAIEDETRDILIDAAGRKPWQHRDGAS